MKCIETSQGVHILSCHASPFQLRGRQEQGVAEALLACCSEGEKQGLLHPLYSISDTS